MLRHNLFASILRRPGARVLPVSIGNALNRFRDDVESKPPIFRYGYQI